MWVSVADLLAAGSAITLWFVFQGTEQTPAITLWFFRILLAAHVLTYLATRHWQPRGDGVALLRLERAPEPLSPQTRILLALIVIVAFALRLPSLGDGLWFDEIDTLLSYAREPVGTITTSFRSRNQHMLYSLVAHGSFRIFGESAWALRLPAVLFGVASLAALFELGRLLTRRDEALAAVALLAVSYQHIWFSQNARGYTGILLWALLGSALFVRLMGGLARRGTAAWAYGAVMALGVFTHATAAFSVVAHALIWAVCAWRKRHVASTAVLLLPLVGMALATTLSLLVYVQVLPEVRKVMAPARMIITATDVDALGSTSGEGIREAPTYIADAAVGWDRILRRLSWFANESLDRITRGDRGGWIALVAAFLLVLIGTCSYARDSPTSLAVLLLPGGVSLLLLFLADQVLFPRFFFFCIGFVALVVARGLYSILAWRGDPWGRRLASATVVVAAVFSLQDLKTVWAPKQDFIGARDYLRQHAGREDAIVAVDLARMPYIKYLHEPWLQAASVAELRGIAAQHPTTWVVYTHAAHLRTRWPEIWDELQTHYAPMATFPATLGDGDVVIVARRADS